MAGRTRHGGTPARLLHHVRLAARASASSAAAAFVIGALLRMVLPVTGAWLAGAAAAGVALAGILSIAAARSPLAPTAAAREPPADGSPAAPTATPAGLAATLEAMATAEQFGHAFLRAAFVLAGFAAGLWLAGLAGVGRA